MRKKQHRATATKDHGASNATPPRRPEKPFHLVLLGAPGVGKGTQAQLICERLGTCHLSTGDLLRAAEGRLHDGRNPALEAALDSMHRGELVPDATVLDLVRERVRSLHCAGGFLLDGFPRTVAQAEALANLLHKEKIRLTAVLDYELPLAKVIARLGGRRICQACNAVFHVSARPSRVAGLCDHCGGSLHQRDDDRPEAIRTRMKVYEQSTRPLINYYAQRGVLITVSAAGGLEEIYQRGLVALNGLFPKRS